MGSGIDRLPGEPTSLIITRCGRQLGDHPPVGNRLRCKSTERSDLSQRLSERLRQVHLIEEERSEEHTSELQSLMRISYAVFCLNKKTQNTTHTHRQNPVTSTTIQHV